MTAVAAPTSTTYERYRTLSKNVRLLGGVRGLLSWDQETYMPPKATTIRAEETALLSGIIHERFVSDEMGDLLESLASDADLGDAERASVRESRRLYDRAKKLPGEFVTELSRTCALAHDAWVDARKRSEFAAFAPWLTKILGLKRREAELVGYESEPYDALLDEYEPGARAAEIGPVLTSLRDKVVPLAKAIAAKPAPKPITGHFPRDVQERFSRQVAEAMGFDFQGGRLDVSAHPFCSGFQPKDVRLTTRYNEADLRQALFGVVHEAGHGIYEQGLAEQHYGTPLAEACSMGFHESQSRMWENVVAGDRAFWEHFFPILRDHFPGPLADVTVEQWHRYVNEVKPSLIRVEADEVTYDLHILLRFEIERALFRNELEVADLPGLWREKMQAYFDLTPPDDARGVLQDIHWSFGGFGYFPTYSLGNLYAAQLFAKAETDLPSLWSDIAKGKFGALKGWLNQNVHAHGARYRPSDLLVRVTGKPLSSEHFTQYLTKKFSEIYGL